jgi:hypothetical protein
LDGVGGLERRLILADAMDGHRRYSRRVRAGDFFRRRLLIPVAFDDSK